MSTEHGVVAGYCEEEAVLWCGVVVVGIEELKWRWRSRDYIAIELTRQQASESEELGGREKTRPLGG